MPRIAFVYCTYLYRCYDSIWTARPKGVEVAGHPLKGGRTARRAEDVRDTGAARGMRRRKSLHMISVATGQGFDGESWRPMTNISAIDPRICTPRPHRSLPAL